MLIDQKDQSYAKESSRERPVEWDEGRDSEYLEEETHRHTLGSKQGEKVNLKTYSKSNFSLLKGFIFYLSK